MSLALSTLKINELAALGLEDLAVLVIDPHHFNPGILYDLIEITNISKQLIPIKVNVDDLSPFFISKGTVTLYHEQRIAVEQDRVDLASLRSIANKKLITYRFFQQLVGFATTAGPGSA